jgi:hypothetical protein
MKLMVCTVGDQTQNANSVETDFAGQMNFTIQYSVIKHGVLSNSQFHFKLITGQPLSDSHSYLIT